MTSLLALLQFIVREKCIFQFIMLQSHTHNPIHSPPHTHLPLFQTSIRMMQCLFITLNISPSTGSAWDHRKKVKLNQSILFLAYSYSDECFHPHQNFIITLFYVEKERWRL